MPDVQSDVCFVCTEPHAYVKVDSTIDAFWVRCPSCGEYHITQDAIDFGLPTLAPLDRVRLRGAIRECAQRYHASESKELAEVRTDTIQSYLDNAPTHFDVAAKARKLLTAIGRRTPHPGEWFQIRSRFDCTLAYAAHIGELIYLTEYLKESGWCEKQYSDPGDQIDMRLTPAGWEELERRPRSDSTKGFVAMWFAPEMSDAFANGMKPAIEDDAHYHCKRIDAVEFNGDIVDKIMAEIRESRFVVADLTGHRNGVYFEAGFALGLGIPVIWTCRNDVAGGTHFDAEHFNQIRWNTSADLREKLETRIRATIGLGPVEVLSPAN